jgi:hypothetical protein
MTKEATKAEKPQKVNQAKKRKEGGRVPRFVFSSSNGMTETERVTKFLNGVKDIAPGTTAQDQFEILCINTIGYVQPLARLVLFNLTCNSNKNEK